MIMIGKLPPIAPIRKMQVFLWICFSILLFTLALWLPAGGFIGGIFASFHSSFAVYQWGIPSGLIVPIGALCGGGIVFALLGGITVLPYFGLFLLMGSLIGLNGRLNRSIGYSIFLPTVIVFLLGTVTFWLQVRHVEEKPFWDAIAYKILQAIMLIAKEHSSGGAVKITPYMEEQIRQTVYFMVRLLPGISFSSLLLTGTINALVTRRYAEKQGLSCPRWKETTKWRSPDVLVWSLIVAGLLTLIPASRIIGLNILIPLGMIYLFQGLSIMLFFFSRWGLPSWANIIIIAIVITQQYLAIVGAFVGLFDVWFDVRRIETEKQNIKE